MQMVRVHHFQNERILTNVPVGEAPHAFTDTDVLFLPDGEGKPKGLPPVFGSAAVHQSGAIVDTFGSQNCTGVSTVAQGWCQHVLQNSSEPKGLSSVFSSTGGATAHV